MISEGPTEKDARLSRSRAADLAEDARLERGRILLDAMRRIAVGRLDNGRPLGGEEARQIAREALVKARMGWRGAAR